jgi:hypothetical protein
MSDPIAKAPAETNVRMRLFFSLRTLYWARRDLLRAMQGDVPPITRFLQDQAYRRVQHAIDTMRELDEDCLPRNPQDVNPTEETSNMTKISHTNYDPKSVTASHIERAMLARETLEEAITMYDGAPSSLTLAHLIRAAHEYVDELHQSNAPLVAALRRAETYLASVKPPIPLPPRDKDIVQISRAFKHRMQDLRRSLKARLGM